MGLMTVSSPKTTRLLPIFAAAFESKLLLSKNLHHESKPALPCAWTIAAARVQPVAEAAEIAPWQRFQGQRLLPFRPPNRGLGRYVLPTKLPMAILN